jgi:N-acylneuraminate cytidylyltransferase
MIEERRILGVIAARGGSKRVPRKNLREVGGRPLIAWSIEQAQASRYLDRVVLSTEDEEIARLGREWGADVPFLRPAELATDEVPGVEPVLHALQQLESFDYVVLLQPTSPLRSASDIDGAIELCAQAAAWSCVSVTPVRENPLLMYWLDGNELRPLIAERVHPVTRPFYLLNGAVYVARTEWLCRHRTFVTEDTIAYVMPAERSLDIDTEADLARFAATISQP